MLNCLKLTTMLCLFGSLAIECTSVLEENEDIQPPIEVITAPFDMPQLQRPNFKTDTFRITNFGAAELDTEKNKLAFRQAIEQCNEQGGGVVLVPEGTWSTGAIHLKSNVNLHLVKGATLLFSSDTVDYLPLVFSRWEGTELYNFSSLIYAHEAENVAITGPGKLDGQGEEWSKKYSRMDWTLPESAVLRLRAMGEAEVPTAERRFGSMPDDILYPSFVHFINCKNILLEDFTINKGPYWTIHPTYSENVIIKGIHVETFGQANGDGINPDACKNVLIEHCVLNTGDDAFTLKSGRDAEGRQRGMATENVVVRHCRADKGHGGIAIGSEMSGGIRNIYVYDCRFKSPRWGIHLKTMRGRGGTVEDIWFEDIQMDSIEGVALRLNMFYHTLPEEPLTERTPLFRNIHFKNITCRYAPVGIQLLGASEQPIRNIDFQNVRLNTHRGIISSYADSLSFKDLTITSDNGLLGQFTESHWVDIDRLISSQPVDTLLVIRGAAPTKYTFSETDTSKIYFE